MDHALHLVIYAIFVLKLILAYLGIIKYMIEQSKPASKLLRTIKEIHNFTVLNDVTIIGFFESESIPLFDAFNDASEKTRGDFATAYVLDPSIRRTMKAEENKIFIYYPEIFWSKYESKFHVLPNQDATSDDIIAFWKEHSTPLVGQSECLTINFPLVVQTLLTMTFAEN